MINWSELKNYFSKDVQPNYDRTSLRYRIKDFRRETKHFFQRLWKGFDNSELWNLDYSLSKIIAPRLKYFKQLHNGYPSNLTTEEWHNILDKMIYSFEFLASEKRWNEYDQELYNKVQEGLDLFAKHYMSLWD